MESANGVRVTSAEIYSKLLEVEHKVNTVVDAVPDHERRIRGLEKAVWVAAGVGTAIGTVASFLLTHLSSSR